MQPLQIGVCNWSLGMSDLDDAFNTIKNTLGLDLIHLGFWDESFNDAERIQGLLDKHGLEVSATCLGFEGESDLLASQSPPGRVASPSRRATAKTPVLVA